MRDRSVVGIGLIIARLLLILLLALLTLLRRILGRLLLVLRALLTLLALLLRGDGGGRKQKYGCEFESGLRHGRLRVGLDSVCYHKSCLRHSTS